MSNAYNNVIYRGFGTPEHGKYIVYGLNANEKMFLTILMITVQLPDASTNESQIVMHTSMSNTYISQERVFKKHLSDSTQAHGLIAHRKYRKRASKHKWVECEYHV